MAELLHPAAVESRPHGQTSLSPSGPLGRCWRQCVMFLDRDRGRGWRRAPRRLQARTRSIPRRSANYRHPASGRRAWRALSRERGVAKGATMGAFGLGDRNASSGTAARDMPNAFRWARGITAASRKPPRSDCWELGEAIANMRSAGLHAERRGRQPGGGWLLPECRHGTGWPDLLLQP